MRKKICRSRKVKNRVGKLLYGFFHSQEVCARQPEFTDESCNAVFGYAFGTISRDDMEDTETIQVVLADKTEAARILKEEKVSLRAAYLLINFLHADKETPFAFLET